MICLRAHLVVIVYDRPPLVSAWKRRLELIPRRKFYLNNGQWQDFGILEVSIVLEGLDRMTPALAVRVHLASVPEHWVPPREGVTN